MYKNKQARYYNKQIFNLSKQGVTKLKYNMVDIARKLAPIDTGNLRYNAIYAIDTYWGFKIVWDNRFANYIKYVNEGAGNITPKKQKNLHFVDKSMAVCLAYADRYIWDYAGFVRGKRLGSKAINIRDKNIRKRNIFGSYVDGEPDKDGYGDYGRTAATFARRYGMNKQEMYDSWYKYYKQMGFKDETSYNNFNTPVIARMMKRAMQSFKYNEDIIVAEEEKYNEYDRLENTKSSEEAEDGLRNVEYKSWDIPNRKW